MDQNCYTTFSSRGTHRQLSRYRTFIFSFTGFNLLAWEVHGRWSRCKTPGPWPPPRPVLKSLPFTMFPWWKKVEVSDPPAPPFGSSPLRGLRLLISLPIELGYKSLNHMARKNLGKHVSVPTLSGRRKRSLGARAGRRLGARRPGIVALGPVLGGPVAGAPRVRVGERECRDQA